MDFKAFGTQALQALEQAGIQIAVKDLGPLLAGLAQIGVEAAKKGEEQLAAKAGVSDPNQAQAGQGAAAT